jgi:hypothetical protein
VRSLVGFHAKQMGLYLVVNGRVHKGKVSDLFGLFVWFLVCATRAKLGP